MATMNVKLLLAESLDTLRKGEEREAATDKLCEEMTKRSNSKRNYGLVRKQFSVAYDTYIKGLEMLNHCRRTAMNGRDDELARFCAEKMSTYMDRCDRLRAKEGNILVSVEQAETSSMDKEGFTVGDSLFLHESSTAIKGNQPIHFTSEVSDGAYQLVVKNYDDYSVAAPLIQVMLQVKHASGSSTTYRKTIPTQSAWLRYIGVVKSATVKIGVVSDAVIRTSKVEVNFRRLIPTDEDESSGILTVGADGKPLGTSGQNWVDGLPPIPTMADLAFNPQQQQYQQPPPPGMYPPPQPMPPGPGYAPVPYQPAVGVPTGGPALPFGEEQNPAALQASASTNVGAPVQDHQHLGMQPFAAPLGGGDGDFTNTENNAQFNALGFDLPVIPTGPPEKPRDAADTDAPSTAHADPADGALGAKEVQSDDEDIDALESQLKNLSIPAKPTPTQDVNESQGPPIQVMKTSAKKTVKFTKPMVNPPVKSQERLEMLKSLLNEIPTEASSVPLTKGTKAVVHGIQSLPMPTDLDFDLGDGPEIGEIGIGEMGDERDPDEDM